MLQVRRHSVQYRGMGINKEDLSALTSPHDAQPRRCKEGKVTFGTQNMVNPQANYSWPSVYPLGFLGSKSRGRSQPGLYLVEGLFSDRLPSGRGRNDIQDWDCHALPLCALVRDLLLFWASAQWLLKASFQELRQGIFLNRDDSSECLVTWNPSPWLPSC